MIPRVCRRLFIAALIAAGACAAPATTSAARPERIVAIGDLHGDHGAWSAIARAAGLVDGNGHWAAGKTVFVQTGDVVDRGPDSLKIIHDLQRLQHEAVGEGGRVVTLVGNHEAMNMTGDLRYVTAGEYHAFVDQDSERRREAFYSANRETIEATVRKGNASLSSKSIREAWIRKIPLGWVEHRASWAPDGEVGRWVSGNDAVALIGDTLFVHGGISPAYANLPSAEINRRVREALMMQSTARNAIINDPLGPLWYRGLVSPQLQSQDDSPDGAASAQVALGPDEQLDLVLKGYGAKRMVVGHTPILAGISIRHDGRLICIDTGDSRYYGGALSYLEIIGDRLIPHKVPRPAVAKE